MNRQTLLVVVLVILLLALLPVYPWTVSLGPIPSGAVGLLLLIILIVILVR